MRWAHQSVNAGPFYYFWKVLSNCIFKYELCFIVSVSSGTPVICALGLLNLSSTSLQLLSLTLLTALSPFYSSRSFPPFLQCPSSDFYLNLFSFEHLII